MKLNEALKHCLDGKRISREEDWWIYWNGKEFMYSEPGWDKEDDYSALDIWDEEEKEDDWEILSAKVSFLEAWQAFLNGKTIVSNLNYKYSRNLSNNSYNTMEMSEMLGEWEIE